MRELAYEDLKRYVKFVMKLEGALYEEKLAIDKVNSCMLDENDEWNYSQHEKEYHVNENDYETENTVVAGASILVVTLGTGLYGAFGWILLRFVIFLFSDNLISQFFLFFMNGIWWDVLVQGFFGGCILGLLLGLFSFVFGIQSNINIKNAFKKATREAKKRNKEVRERNLEIDEENEERRKWIINRNRFLSEEAERIYNISLVTKKILDKTYSLNVIHSDYRYNLSYICSIYGYLDTGRCRTLEGHEGAYNLLDNDIKFKMIIDKMDEIINKLDNIRDNQNTLYGELNRIYNNVDRLNNSISEISNKFSQGLSSLNTIENSLDSIQYNSAIVARNSDFQRLYLFFNSRI